MSWEQKLSAFTNDIQSSVAGKDQMIMEQLVKNENECYTSAGNDSEKFVKCMTNTMKKLEKEEKRFEFRMAFFQAKTAECFKNSTNDQSLDKCKSDALKSLESYFNDFIKNIQ